MISRLELTNVACFRHFEVRFGCLTVILGRNGSGKSTLLKALTSIFEGGHDPSIIRNFGTREAADKALVVMEMDDGVTFRKSVTAKGYQLTAVAADGQKLSAPASLVNAMATGFALDPARFVECGKLGAAGQKERVKFLQAIFPSTFTAEEVAEAIAGWNKTLDMDGFNALLTLTEDARRTAAASEKTIKATVDNLEGGLPEEMAPEDHAGQIEKLDAKLAEIQSLLRQEHARIAEESSHKRDEAMAERDEKIAMARSVYDKAVEFIAAESELMKESANALFRDTFIEIKSEIMAARAKYDAYKQFANTKDYIAKLKTEMRDHAIKYTELDRKVEDLRRLKKRKLEASPFPWLEIRDGRVLVDGLDFDTQINTARQWEVTIQICALAPGRLPFFVCDRMESLDDAAWQEFKVAALRSGFQVLVTRVSMTDDEDLKIVTYDSEQVEG